MFNCFSGIAQTRQPKLGFVAVLAFCGSVSGTCIAEPFALAERQQLQNQVFVLSIDNLMPAWVFPVVQQPNDDWQGGLVEFAPLVAPQSKAVAHKSAEQKADNADRAGGADAERIPVHLCLLVFALCFLFGFGVGLGPLNSRR